jgi:hypothetical protein
MVKIIEKGQYKNINLGEMTNKESIVIEKIFLEGREIKSKFQPMKYSGKKTVDGKPEMVLDESKPISYNYGCKGHLISNTLYNDEVEEFLTTDYNDDVSFFINTPEDHKVFAECGGIGDKVKITCKAKIVKNKKNKDVVERKYTFEKVE